MNFRDCTCPGEKLREQCEPRLRGRSLGLVSEETARLDRCDDFRLDVRLPLTIPASQHREDIIRSKIEFVVREPFEGSDVSLFHEIVDKLRHRLWDVERR